MPPQAQPSLEVVEINSAYADRLRGLYQMLAIGLTDAAVTKETEAQCVEKFKRGLQSAKRARELALAAVGAAGAIA